MQGEGPFLTSEASTSDRLRATAGALLDLLFPWCCAGCGSASGEALCARCRAAIRWLPVAVCPVCGLPSDTGSCGRCRLWPPTFRRARALAVYGAHGGSTDPLGEALRALKYGRRRALAGPLGQLLAGRLPFARGEHDVVVPVPLHPTRLRERGFNQALLIARAPARRLGVPLLVDALRRVRATPSQASLEERDRRRNVRHAFRATRPQAFRERRVLLVDDVVTSGATVDACARALTAAGAAAVDVLSLARTLRPDRP